MAGEGKPKIDGHCHLFNLWYLISELVAAGHDAARGEYPRRAPGRAALKSKEALAERPRERAGASAFGDAERTPSEALGDAERTPSEALGGTAGLLSEIREMIKRVSQLGRSMFNDYEGNYGLIQDKFGRAFPGEAEPELFPLMMDIYYMFDGLFEDGSSAKAEGWSEETDALLSSWLSETRGAVRGIAEERARKPSPHQGMLQAELEKIEGKFDELETARATGAEWPDSVAMTPGYESEIRQSIELWKRHPGKVYPFLAVDPRRDGVMELVAGGGCFGIEGPLVSRAGPFYGVKLYPRLGYKPAEVEAIGLLEWCARGGIPITYHCNETGFPPWPGEWKWSGNGDPRLWEPYLKKYRGVNGGLRIDFAHFGDARPEWRRAIASYASNSLWRYGRNAYTDIACFVHPESLKRAKAAYDRRLRSVRGKLIFGSDYDVMLLVSDLDLESYYEQYKEVFKDDKKHAYAEDMMNRAPRAFLNARPR